MPTEHRLYTSSQVSQKIKSRVNINVTDFKVFLEFTSWFIVTKLQIALPSALNCVDFSMQRKWNRFFLNLKHLWQLNLQKCFRSLKDFSFCWKNKHFEFIYNEILGFKNSFNYDPYLALNIIDYEQFSRDLQE